jgi:DNA-binding transcriptional ArsR family regulator
MSRVGGISADPLSLTFAALADPTRRAMLLRLASGEKSVTELAKPFDMTFQAITEHLKVLQRDSAVRVGHHIRGGWRQDPGDAVSGEN